jgi:hypothetical protein
MRILHVYRRFVLGGSETVMLGCGRVLQKQGIESAFFVGRSSTSVRVLEREHGFPFHSAGCTRLELLLMSDAFDLLLMHDREAIPVVAKPLSRVGFRGGTILVAHSVSPGFVKIEKRWDAVIAVSAAASTHLGE